MVILVTSSSSSKTEFTRIFYDVFDVGGYVGSSRLEVSLLYFLKRSRSFDATRLPLSNKLEFAQFGAHLQKLWQFWFPSGSTAGRSGSTAWVLQAAVPLHSGSTARDSTTVVPLGCLAPPPRPQPLWRDPLSLLCPSGSTALPAVVRPKGHKWQYRSTAVVPPVTPLS